MWCDRLRHGEIRKPDSLSTLSISIPQDNGLCSSVQQAGGAKKILDGQG